MVGAEGDPDSSALKGREGSGAGEGALEIIKILFNALGGPS